MLLIYLSPLAVIFIMLRKKPSDRLVIASKPIKNKKRFFRLASAMGKIGPFFRDKSLIIHPIQK